jgi:hypothetical protein
MMSLSQFVDTLKLIVSILPTLIDAIRVAEQVCSGSGLGKEKLELVRSIVEAAYSNSTDIARSFDIIWPSLQKAISAIVTIFNKTGEFSK